MGHFRDWFAFCRIRELNLILDRYRDNLYVFISSRDPSERRVRDMIAIRLVRIAQAGNVLAKKELVALIRSTIDDWLGFYDCLRCWIGREDDEQMAYSGLGHADASVLKRQCHTAIRPWVVEIGDCAGCYQASSP